MTREPNFNDVGIVFDKELCDRDCPYLIRVQDGAGAWDEDCIVLAQPHNRAGDCPEVDAYLETATPVYDDSATQAHIHDAIIAPLAGAGYDNHNAESPAPVSSVSGTKR